MFILQSLNKTQRQIKCAVVPRYIAVCQHIAHNIVQNFNNVKVNVNIVYVIGTVLDTVLYSKMLTIK